MSLTKNILIIHGHPDAESYCAALGDAYKKGAESNGGEVEEIVLRELDFDLNLHFGYRKRTELEPCLIEAQEKISNADHLVFIYPLWWGAYPALLKGFIDRVFLPGFAFQKRENSVWWDKYLTGKSARIICTMDQPPWYFRLINSAPAHHAMKKLTLHFSGIKPVRITSVGPIRLSKDSFREKWLKKIEKLGTALR